MEIQLVSECDAAELQRLVARIPFLKTLQEADVGQSEKFLSLSRLATVDPNTTIMRGGDRGNWIYFILSGRVGVYTSGAAGGKPVGLLSVGELFGDMALFTDATRVATIKAAPDARGVKLLASDFTSLCTLDDFDSINLNTKLIFYRMLVQRARWRLEKNKILFPSHSFFGRLKEVPHMTAQSGGYDELKQLHAQAVFLTELQVDWNDMGLAREQNLDGAA